MPSAILARADALMQRRRQNLPESDDVPVLTDVVETLETDEFPVLLDIAIDEIAPPPEPFISSEPVDESTLEAREPGAPEIPAPSIAESDDQRPQSGVRDILAHELACRIEQRIIAELPRLIESTVKDFLAEQEMIAAPQSRD